MATTQEILQALAQMQQTAQGNLPVIPNNGNPHGANNMASSDPALPEDRGVRTPPWLQASPAMAEIHRMLASYNQPPPMSTGTPPGVMPKPVQPPMITRPGGPDMGFNDGQPQLPPMPGLPTEPHAPPIARPPFPINRMDERAERLPPIPYGGRFGPRPR